MIKFERYDSEDLEFIDPKIIQPLGQSLIDENTCDQDYNSALNTAQEDSSPVFSGESVRMEQCINLDWYVSPIMENNAISTTDELNTPIFDAAVQLNVTNIPNTYYPHGGNMNPFNFPARIKQEDRGQQQPSTDVNNTNCRENSVVNSDIMGGSLLLSNNDDAFDGINMDEYDLLSDYNDAIMPDIIDTEDAVSPVSVVDHHSYSLKLDLNKASANVAEDLQTPDVINTICSIENDYPAIALVGKEIKLEEVNTSPNILIEFQDTVDQEATQWYQETSNDSTTTYSPKIVVNPSPTKRERKRKRNTDDDDEDYVPPGSYIKPGCSSRSVYTESDDEEEIVVKRRSKPKKRVSISSENSEPSKYREMRDKNNEASRRSRQKRKMQEQSFEQEREDLERKNIQLKAQVAELERTVTNFRTDLMNLMMKK